MSAGLPTGDELASDWLSHRPADHFAPPALTNFLGAVQVAVDPVALWNLSFPPLACGDVESGRLFVDGWVFAASGEPVASRWYPDRVERTAAWRGLEIESTTVLAWASSAAIVRFRVRNVSGAERRVRIGLGFLGSVARSTEPWHRAEPPTELVAPSPNDGMDHGRGAAAASVVVDAERGAVVFLAPSGAASLQGVVPRPEHLDDRGGSFELDLPSGATWQGTYVHALGDDVAAARALYDRIARDVDGEMARVRAEWQAEIEAAFTPGNSRYSGWLPVLESDDRDLRRLYYLGALGVIYFKRESPASVVGRAYDTLMPRYWATNTFIWDYSLSSLVHALLDPAEMRGQLERWMAIDLHTCFGSDWLTGRPVGAWYAVNDHAMTQLIDRYLCWSGDPGWLDASVTSVHGESSVGRELERFATAWRGLAGVHGLADYGEIDNLLECVSSYVHEVAALNAANVWNLRTAGSHLRGDRPDVAERLRSEAATLAAALWELYEEGEGWFNARMPDGRRLPVRHCYDLLIVLDLLVDDIPDRRRDEMVRYFQEQLQTPTWLRALSPADPDAITSVRPDHQWNGAYTAWPALMALGLYRIGREDLASPWLRGLAASANQGPFGQAHFIEEYLPADAGGAAKAPSGWPWINDWACASGGAWSRLVIEGVFGVRATPNEISASPRLDGLDADARLVGLRHQGRLHEVDRRGIRPG